MSNGIQYLCVPGSADHKSGKGIIITAVDMDNAAQAYFDVYGVTYQEITVHELTPGKVYSQKQELVHHEEA